MFYVYEIQSLLVSIENYYCLTFVEFTLRQPTWQATWEI
jgi:hypothetical protein